MALTNSINRGRRTSVKAVSEEVPVNFTNDIYVISTGLKEPITVTKESGDAAVVFQENGSRVNVSLSSPLAVGQTVTAVFKAQQPDGSFVGGPVSITGTAASVITLDDLSISRDFINEGSTTGRLLGSLIGKTSGSTLTLVDDAGGRFVLSGTNILTGIVPLDYEESPTLSITIRETKTNAVNSPKDTVINVTVNNVYENPSLGTLTLSANQIPENSVAGTTVGTLSGKTSGSTLSLIDDAGGLFALSGNQIVTTASSTDYETAVSHSITVRETLTDSATPTKDTSFTILVTNIFEQPNLSILSLSNNTIPENTSSGTIVGTISGKTTGSTLSIIDDAGGRFVLSGSNIITGLVSTNYETATSHSITIRETLSDSANSPRDTVLTINVSNVLEASALSALTLSTYTLSEGTPAVINIIGATAGSTIIGSVPDGMVLNSSARTISGTPTNSSSYEITLVESLADSPNSPRSNILTIEVLSSTTVLQREADGSVTVSSLAGAPSLIANRQPDGTILVS